MIKKIKGIFYNITHWESWHYLAKYIPLAPVWFYYAIRSRSLWWFTPSNPSLTFGGFEGEKKREMYEQLPAGSYPNTIYIKPGSSFKKLVERVKKAHINFPVAVKPDAGMMGLMFRKINNEDQLMDYHSVMEVDYLVQEMISYPLEVSVFYFRYPSRSSGRITGFLKKELLEVTGDGASTLELLIENYSRADLHIDELKSKHHKRLKDIIPKDEAVILSQALNLSRGGKLVSLEHEIDQKLLAVFDQISLYSRKFYYGRYDIKCNSIEELKQGKNFTILEFNGSGAEPHHIYGNQNSLLKAYRIVILHWRALFTISRINFKKGIIYWDFWKGWKFLTVTKRHFRSLKKLDASFSG